MYIPGNIDDIVPLTRAHLHGQMTTLEYRNALVRSIQELPEEDLELLACVLVETNFILGDGSF